MIHQILDFISKEIGADRHKLNYALISRGVYRSENAYRNIALIFIESKPIFIAKWYRHNTPENTEKAKHEQRFSQGLAKNGILVPDIVFAARINNTEVSIEKFIAGNQLEHLLTRKLCSKEQVVNYAYNVANQILENTKTTSTIEALKEEVEKIFIPVLTQVQTKDHEICQFLLNVKQQIVDWYSLFDKIETFFVHGDFNLSNLILSENKVWLYDFEFGKRSHFAFYDWFRLWHFSKGFSINELSNFQFPKQIKNIFSTEASYTNSLVLFDLIDFHTQVSVHPSYKYDELFDRLLITLSNRLHRNNISVALEETPKSLAIGKYSDLPLEGQVEFLRNELNWYTRKFREVLVSHHAVVEGSKQDRKNAAIAQKEINVLVHEITKIGLENDNLRIDNNHLTKKISTLETQLNEVKNSPQFLSIRSVSFLDRLPKALKYPLKAIKVIFSQGPLHLVRIMNFRKMIKRKPLLVLDPAPLIEVVTLSYNSTRFIDDYFQAFTKIDYPKDKIILNIIDNASKDDSYQMIKEKYLDNPSYPIKVNLERSRRNLGFSGGNNKVLNRLLRTSPAHYFFLLNIDTKINPSCFNHLVQTMKDDPFTGMAEAIQEPREHPKWYDPKTFETGWCSGGGVLIKREALKEVGVFDHKFFLYCEDVDLSWRMWLHGWKCKVNPAARYSHFTESLDKERNRDIQRYYSVRNSFFMHLKYDSVAGIRRHKKYFDHVVSLQQDPNSQRLLRKAFRSHIKYIPLLLVDRLHTKFYPPIPWVVFDGFNYEKRREFKDLEDGRRIIMSA